MVQQDHKYQLSHLHLICTPRIYITFLVLESWCQKAVCRFFYYSLPISNVCKSCRGLAVNSHPQDLREEDCSLVGENSLASSLWLLCTSFVLFNLHKADLAELRIEVRSILTAELILCLVLVHVSELLALFSQINESLFKIQHKGKGVPVYLMISPAGN